MTALERAAETTSLDQLPARPGSRLSNSFLVLRRNPLGAVGLAILLVLVIAAIAAGVVAPYDPNDTSFTALDEPSMAHPFGTDLLGRDILSRVIYGARVSLAVGFGSVAIGLMVGTLFGLVSGYLGGIVDTVLQRIIDVLMAFPLLILAIFIAAVAGQGMWKSIMVLGVAITPGVARVVRGSVLTERARDYVLAGKSIGVSELRIMFLHVLPNVLAPIIVFGTTLLAAAVLAEASLSFLGLGIPPPTVSWGSDLSGTARTYFEIAPWMAIFPGAALTLAVLGLNFLGDAIRDVMDPRLQRDMMRRNV